MDRRRRVQEKNKQIWPAAHMRQDAQPRAPIAFLVNHENRCLQDQFIVGGLWIQDGVDN